MLSRSERMDFLDRGASELPLKTQAGLLGLSRSSLYYVPRSPSPEQVAIRHAIDQLFTDCPFYGSRRISFMLREQGLIVNRKAVQAHMRAMGLEAVYPGPNLSLRNQEHKIFPYLLRRVTISTANQVWGTDITYIRLKRGWMYLVALIDWYSRYVVGWELSDNLETTFVLDAVSKAFEIATPGILNSDQGSQYTSPDYTSLVLSAGVQVSMDGRGRALDNVFTERFWRSLKREEVYMKEYGTPREARKGIAGYIDFYNNKRPHQSLDYQTPVSVYSEKAGVIVPSAVIQRPIPRGGKRVLNPVESVS